MRRGAPGTGERFGIFPLPGRVFAYFLHEQKVRPPAEERILRFAQNDGQYNGREYTNLTWTQGRRLSSIKKGTDTYSYEYDMSGVRSVKIADGVKHEYVTQNGRVVRDYVTYAGTDTFVRCTDFFYDEAGRPFAMRCYYDSTLTGADTLHYVLNAQGDVVQLIYQGGTVYAEYSYDTWGNVTSIKGSSTGDMYYANLNPLRYRGYYYDTETGFYYLQSRYYDPDVKRFLNADSYGSTGQGFLGFNMFAYCNNNPVSYCDPSGHFSILNIVEELKKWIQEIVQAEQKSVID